MSRLGLVLGVAAMLAAYTALTVVLAPSSLPVQILDKPGYVKIEGASIIVEANATGRVYVATVRADKPVLIMVGGQQLSLVPPAMLLAVSVTGNETVGPASVILLPKGTWRLYIDPRGPGVFVIEAR